MINLAKIEEVVIDQLEKFKFKDAGIIRDIDFDRYVKTKQITIISGIRRCGKSTLLAQLSKKFENFYYINFDDERLINFDVGDFEILMIAFQKMYTSKVILLDEIQNIEKWERFVRRIYDEGYKIFITGSNARLLSSELATHLTGRYFKIELFPFSFKEFLALQKVDYKQKGTENKIKVLKNFDFYLENGGFPEFLKYKDTELLKRVYEDVLYRDLLTRFKIRESKSFKQLAMFLFTNFTKEISYNSLKDALGFKSPVSVKNYIEFMQESFLIFELYKYDYSLKKQYVSNKKIYVIDNGMRNTIAFSISQDKGKMLENLVFLELRRRGNYIYFFKDKYECDFIIQEKNKIIRAFQVTHNFNDVNSEREINGLIDTMGKFNLTKGLILTLDQNNIIVHNNLTINIMPVWEWLCL